MPKIDKLHDAISSGKTILGVGPMSWNCVDAVIELANDHDIPMKLISSRRQVEAESLGGGYVTSTEKLSEYVRERDKKGLVFLARDHGGPWQGTNESELSHTEALHTACVSFSTDLRAGFDIIHIDPSLKSRPLEEIIGDVLLLYEFCENQVEIPEAPLQPVIYEVGTEEHSGQITNPIQFGYFVDEMVYHCPKVKFVVGNMGLWVKEVENVGKFDVKQAEKFVKICNINGLYLKGHNSDYVRPDILHRKNRIGVHSINVAPEFGVRETEELLWLFEFHRMDVQRQKFIEIAVNSGKWRKWMKNPDEDVPDLYKAKICGHYVFTDPKVEELKSKLRKKCPDLDERLKNAVKSTIKSYLDCLGWTKELNL